MVRHVVLGDPACGETIQAELADARANGRRVQDVTSVRLRGMNHFVSRVVVPVRQTKANGSRLTAAAAAVVCGRGRHIGRILSRRCRRSLPLRMNIVIQSHQRVLGCRSATFE